MSLHEKDEGVIKFDLHWKMDAPPLYEEIKELILVRDEVFQMKWIGFDEEENVGYGNISIRSGTGFIISGTQTGHIPATTAEHYTKVISWSIENNSLACVGPCKASSESLTHAAIYQLDEKINCVIHIHQKEKWLKVLGKIPTTNKETPYGTVEMANEISRLWENDSLKEKKVLAMAGHEGGIIGFGNDPRGALSTLKKLFLN